MRQAAQAVPTDVVPINITGMLHLREKTKNKEDNQPVIRNILDQFPRSCSSTFPVISLFLHICVWKMFQVGD